MCATCGCASDTPAKVTSLEAELVHRHHPHSRRDEPHDHSHAEYPHEHHVRDHDVHHSDGVERPPVPASRTIKLERDVLAKNELLAERNRGWLEAKGIVAWNLMSSPGAGKTTLLERTIRDLGGELPICVIEGDQETALDAERIRAAGARVVQINTGSGCHLDADMVAAALRKMSPPAASLLMIENVGNLVCPALFNLGERGKVVIMSVTEGEDKPIKYPHMFRASDLMVLNKIDLLPHVRFDVERCVASARQVNPRLSIVQISATHGDGLGEWYAWLRSQVADADTKTESARV
jgi:hydrogenase nickel incorporation protein HypB